MKKVCLFGIYDPKQWRNRILMEGLKHAGYEITECRVNPRETKGISKYIKLYKMYKNLDTKFDYIVVGFPGYLTVFVARFMTTSPIIFDAYISYFDGLRDRCNYSLFHPMMWYAWTIDFLSGICSDIVLTINYAYKDFFIKTLKISENKVEVLHKGADESIFYPRDYIKQKEKYTIGWWGSFIPLHGVSFIIEAANLLRDDQNIEFQIIGGGQLANDIKAQIEKYDLKNVIMSPYIPQVDLVQEISKFDIVLGIFSPAPKAGRCVTNKVYEAMAMGKTIITEDSMANREIFTHKKNAYLVPAGDSTALVKAIKNIIEDESLRFNLELESKKLFKENFTSEKIENELFGIIKRHEK